MRLPFFKNSLHATTSTIPQSTLTSTNDLEKNLNITSQHAPPQQQQRQLRQEDLTDPFSPNGLPPKLVKFQTLTGISSPNLLGANIYRPARNEGIYKRTVDEETKVSFQYSVSNYVVNIGGMLQIVLGAALTALGAANGPSAAVTILGAVNTITAGLLTYLKGQGLPMRLEQYLHMLRTLREHIEAREREFLEPDCPLDVDWEIENVARMYQEVRQTAEDNAPGTVLPPRGAITSLLKKPDIRRDEVMAPRGDKSAMGMLAGGLRDLATFGKHAEQEAEAKMGGAAEREKTAMGETIERENTMMGESAERGKAAAEGGKQSLGAEIQHLGEVAKDTFERIKSSPHGERELRRSLDQGGGGR